LKETWTHDPHRPRYHFLPLSNWMNDPNGLIQWRGRYHLFYQHNPEAPSWGAMHWGHAVSEDLAHWQHLPIALTPTPGGPDKDGCWSGCAVDNDGVPTLIYTGVMPEVQCIATSADGLLTWQEHPANPVIAAPPEGLEVTGFRDPCVWREGRAWYAVVGSGIKGVGGTALLYRSDDLVNWEYLNPICIGDREENGEMWECPDLFPLGDRHVLLFGAHPEFRYTCYFTGRYAAQRFTPESQGKADFGGYFYAAQTLLDDQGRRIMWGWLKEGRSDEAIQAAGWAGVMSLPRILTLRPDGRLGIEPAPELRALRRQHHRWREVELTPTSPLTLKEVQGDGLEIAVEFEPGDAAALGLQVRCSPDGAEGTRIVYDRAARCLAVHRKRSSLSAEVHRDRQEGALDLSPGEGLRLHVFLDRSVVEIYANGHVCLTSRIYPSRPDSLSVGLLAHGGRAKVRSLDVWQMADIGLTVN